MSGMTHKENQMMEELIRLRAMFKKAAVEERADEQLHRKNKDHHMQSYHGGRADAFQMAVEDVENLILDNFEGSEDLLEDANIIDSATEDTEDATDRWLEQEHREMEAEADERIARVVYKLRPGVAK